MSSPAEIAALRERVAELVVGSGELPDAERGVQLAYLEGNAWRYAALLAHVERAFGRALRGVTVLDVGAYPGHLAALLARDHGAHVTAVTLVETEAFAARLRSLGVRVAACDVERDPLPAADGSVDLVLCCELIEHLDGDVEHLLAEARRALAPGGLLVLTTPNHASVERRWALVRGRSVYPPLDDPVYPFYAGAGVRNPWRHVREFTGDEIARLLGRCGFWRVEVATVSPPASRAGLSARGRAVSAALRVAARLLERGGTTLVATARS